MADLQNIILGIGNPLLDISAEVPLSVFEKYEIKPASACLAEEKHLPLYKELVKEYPVEYIAGGAAQNTIRAAQWMIQTPGATNYIGCIGKDDFGEQLKKSAETDGVKTQYLLDDAPTGTCAVLVHEKDRSLVANLSAANNFKIDHLLKPEIQALINEAKFFYTTGFFLTHSPAGLVLLGKNAAEHDDKTFIFNLSAPFLIDFFWQPMEEVLQYADIVISNEDEAQALGKKHNWGDDLKVIAEKLAAFPKINSKKTRTVIFTQGSKNTIVYQNGKILEFSPLVLPASAIIDTNGAGDSFAGGFLAGLALGKPLETCISAGHYCASEVIQTSGCKFPPKPNFQF